MASRTPLLLLLVAALCGATVARAAWPAPEKLKDLNHLVHGPSNWEIHAVPDGLYITYHQEMGVTPKGLPFFEEVIWASDGTAAGTVKLDNALIGGAPSKREFDRSGRIYPIFIGAAGMKAAIVHRTDADSEDYLWVVDLDWGRRVRIGPWGPFNSEQPTPQVLDDPGRLYLKTDSGAVWQSDATTAGTRRVADIAGAGMNWGILQQQVVLDAYRDALVGRELYRHSLATSTTTLIEDFRPGVGIIAGKERPLSSNPAKFMFFQERLYFGVSTPQPTLYRINAKLLAPQLVSESVMDFRFAGVCIVLDTFLQDQTFVSLSIDLQNTVNLGTFPETIEWVVQGDRNLFIIGRSRPDQSRLAWMIDGTLEGSREIVIPGDIAPRESWPWLVEDFVGIGRRLFFKGEDQLWGYDFDRKDFKRLSGAPTGEIGKPSVPVMASLNGCLYAVLYNRITGYGLYRFDMSGFDQTAAENWTMFE